jgi:hypothetical protein
MYSGAFGFSIVEVMVAMAGAAIATINTSGD